MIPPKISDLLDKINTAVENPAFPAVSKLERDLLMQQIRDFYEEIDTATHNRQNGAEVTQPDKREVVKDPTVLIKRPAIRPNEDLLIKEEATTQKPVELLKTEVVVTKEEKIVVTKPEINVEPRIERKVEKAVQTGSPSINESIKTGGSLNEKLKTSSGVEMHKRLAIKPLKELIDLNKRFVLLNELFKGNAEAYASAIAHIDTLADYDAAQSFISTQLVSNYYWDETKQSTRMFSKLVKMKFGVE
jgi:hypothetical protein